MMKFKDIRAYLDKEDVTWWDSEDGQHICICACAFGTQNFFDYGEPYKITRCYRKEKFWKELFSDPRIIILSCDDCSGCSGW